MKGQFLLWLVGSMTVFLSAASVSRAYVANNQIWTLILSLGLYCVGNLMVLKLMRLGGLGMAISVSAIAQLLFINIIAFLFFGERLSAMQMAGVALGAIAMALMLLPMQGKA